MPAVLKGSNSINHCTVKIECCQHLSPAPLRASKRRMSPRTCFGRFCSRPLFDSNIASSQQWTKEWVINVGHSKTIPTSMEQHQVLLSHDQFQYHHLLPVVAEIKQKGIGFHPNAKPLPCLGSYNHEEAGSIRKRWGQTKLSKIFFVILLVLSKLARTYFLHGDGRDSKYCTVLQQIIHLFSFPALELNGIKWNWDLLVKAAAKLSYGLPGGMKVTGSQKSSYLQSKSH